MPGPWTVVGWILVAILVALIIVTPIAAVWILRQRRRALDAFQRRADEIDREIREPLHRHQDRFRG